MALILRRSDIRQCEDFFTTNLLLNVFASRQTHFEKENWKYLRAEVARYLQNANNIDRIKVCEKVCAELNAHLQSAAGIEKGLSGLVVFIQRFDSTANLNIHFHDIALDGFYEKKSTGRLKFYTAQAASVAHRIAFGPNAGQPIRLLKTQTHAIYGTPSHLG